MEKKKYDIIYADPPWTFKTYSDKGKVKAPDRHYDVMTKADIQNLDVQSISSDDCVLFLWVTFPCLKEGLELIEAWGFTYKTIAFNWVKRNKIVPSWFWGLGYWTRSNSEICLLATKGKPKRISKSVHQVIDTPIESHSKKPEIVKERIVQLIGNLPRIELFARQQTIGWDVFGNQVNNSIVI